MEKVTKPVFSTELYNARVETQIQAFFEAMNELYKRRGWLFDLPHREDMSWSNADFTVAVIDCYRDGAYKRFRFIMRNLPGYSLRPNSLTDTRAIRYQHSFVFDLPREYPQNIGTIRPATETSLYHPRLGVGGQGHACYSVRGELDRILEDLPFFVLLKPDRVEPPSQFQSDHGLNREAMEWYEQNTENIVTTLDRLWDARHLLETPSTEQRDRVRILKLSRSISETSHRQPRILDESEAPRLNRVRILDSLDAEDEE